MASAGDAPSAASRFYAILRRERWWILGCAALFTFCRIPTVDGWDDAFYVGQLLSVVQDGDLRLQDDVVLVPEPLGEKHRILTTTAPSGALANTFSIGPAVLDAPLVSPFLPNRDRGGGWQPFRAATAVNAMMMVALTALAASSSVRRFGISAGVANLATGLALLCGPLAVYATRAQLHAHLGGALLVALALRLALCWLEERRLESAIAFGLAAGLGCANRWQDVAVFGPLALGVMAASRSGSRITRAGLALATGAGALGAALQLVAWQVQFGTPLLVPQGPDYMHWSDPNIVRLLFSSFHGLVPWTPGYALGLAALVTSAIAARRRAAAPRPLLLALAAGSVLAVYVSACPTDWWGGASFSARRLSSLAAPAALGLGLLLQRCSARWRVAVSLLLASWAIVAVSAHISGFEDLGVLLAGQPGPLPPPVLDAPAPSSVHWATAWGPLHFIVPGFSLSDAPRAVDRVLGLLIVVASCALLRLAWPMVLRTRAARIALVGCGVAYLLAWNVVLARCPSNTGWNRQWRAFLEAPLDESRLAALPPDTAAAGRLVSAFEAARTGDAARLAQSFRALPELGVTAGEAEIMRAALRPRLPYP